MILQDAQHPALPLKSVEVERAQHLAGLSHSKDNKINPLTQSSLKTRGREVEKDGLCGDCRKPANVGSDRPDGAADCKVKDQSWQIPYRRSLSLMSKDL